MSHPGDELLCAESPKEGVVSGESRGPMMGRAGRMHSSSLLFSSGSSGRFSSGFALVSSSAAPGSARQARPAGPAAASGSDRPRARAAM